MAKLTTSFFPLVCLYIWVCFFYDEVSPLKGFYENNIYYLYSVYSFQYIYSILYFVDWQPVPVEEMIFLSVYTCRKLSQKNKCRETKEKCLICDLLLTPPPSVDFYVPRHNGLCFCVTV